jgi:hypothetical protein
MVGEHSWAGQRKVDPSLSIESMPTTIFFHKVHPSWKKMEASKETWTQKVLNKEDAFNHYAKFWNLDFEYWDIQLILKTHLS